MLNSVAASLRSVRAELRPVNVEAALGAHRRRPLARVGVIGTVNRVTSTALRFVGAIILSRILPPEVFGTLAMVLFFQAFLTMFGGAGFVEAAVQKTHLTLAQLNGVFWLNTGVGFVLGGSLFLAGPAIQNFYGLEDIAAICRVLGLVMILENIFTAYGVVLKRTMRSEISLVTSVVSVCVSLLTSVTMALLGFGVWSLVGAIMVEALTRRALLRYFVRWSPGPLTRGVGLRSISAYGIKATGMSLVGFLSNNVQTLALGKFAAPADVGYFNRGQSLFLTPIQQIAHPIIQMSFPALSSLQADKRKLLDLVHRVDWLLGLLLLPLAGVMLVYGDWILIWLIGPNWTTAGEVVRWMALSQIPGFFTPALAKANAAIGRPARAMPVHLLGLPLMVIGVFYTAPHGAVAVAQFYAAYRWGLQSFLVGVSLKGSGLNVARCLASGAQLFVMICPTLGALYLLRTPLSEVGDLGRFFCVALLAGLAYLFQWLAYRKFRLGRSVLQWLFENFGQRLKLPKWLFV